ncbi:mucin-binding protein [Streptococcus halichoeri]|uniref:mucin-binding protein n=1 Tax=Streptococcus halichoeri TaxID=254785 RepID=UPI00135B1C10|nr:KxYKxGKxW signal peptide domain-containing protein [Streptococcus halichoeri]
MMRKASPETKVTKYRMWKSGKQWLFGASLVAASLLVMNTQAFADDGNQGGSEATSTLVASTPGESSTTPEGSKEAVSETEASPQPAAMVAGSEGNSGSESSQEAPKPVALQSEAAGENLSSVVEQFKEKKPVTIYYETNDDGDYYAHVWGDIDKVNDQAYSGTEKDGAAYAMQKVDGGNKWKVTITPKDTATHVNYIIKKGTDWANKKTGDMVATVNIFTETTVYVGEDYYSQISNLQSKAFDKEFGYTDKVVDEANTEGDHFKTVGKAGRLGARLNADGTARINVWAPTAKSVKLNVYTSLDDKSESKQTFEMTRGITKDEDHHENNTVGVWSFTISKEVLAQLNRTSADLLAYDFELTLPNAYFIQIEENDVTIDGIKKKIKIYRNSATKQFLNYDWKDGSQTLFGKNREASREEVAAFYAGGKLSKNGDKIKVVVENDGYQTVRTQDPYSVAVVRNGSRSVILDPSKHGKKVTVTKNVRVKTNSEVNVLEANVRDFSIDSSSGVSEANKGNFLGVVEAKTKTASGQMTGIDYLKYLGFNYLQLMPINDYETVPELDKNDPVNTEIAKEEADGVHNNQQNWGYDPKNYNVPDGSYSSDPTDPTVRIKEVKQMVQGLHDAGLNVIIDVVYNHLYDGQANVFERTVPGYYYAIDFPANIMNNNVGVGNTVRSNSEMMRQYIINSAVYWAVEYGVDGYRFDAMSDLDTKTLNELKAALDKISPGMVVYGEGWSSMGKYLVEREENGKDVPKNEGELPASDRNISLTPSYGTFDLYGRDAIAGHGYSSDNVDTSGFVNNNVRGKESAVANALLGKAAGHFGTASQQLNYIQCHDGMTLRDLLQRGNNDDAERLKKRVELANAVSGLAQGIHFSEMGQEFQRSKEGKHNTYNAGDEFNRIKWDLIKENIDVVNFTKAFTQLRRQEKLFQLSDYKDIEKYMIVTNAQTQSGVITYELRLDSNTTINKNGKYLVIFNNIDGDASKTLTLGDTNWYYGGNEKMGEFHNTENNRGIINKTNDFSKAFIVTTNSKSLYNKIGRFNGSKTITVDPLSATVLFIPGESVMQGVEKSKQTISYVDTHGNQLKTANEQEIAFLKVMEFDPSQKFTFEKSGIATTSEDQLGHRENIIKTVNDTDGKVVNYYYAVDKNGRFATEEELKKVTFGDDGKLSTIDGYTWHLAPASTKEVVHPQIPGYEVLTTNDTSQNMEKVPSHQLAGKESTEITVTYAKNVHAYLFSSNDPKGILPKDGRTMTSDYHVDGFEEEAIAFNVQDEDLVRDGYTYEVNGHNSLQEALEAENGGIFASSDVIFKVVYSPAPAKALVRYIDKDDNDKLIKRVELGGKMGEEITHEIVIPTHYELASKDFNASGNHFDAIDDTGTPSQVFTVVLRHQRAEAEQVVDYTVHYNGADQEVPDTTQSVTWAMEQDMVTGSTSYTPEGGLKEVLSPDVEGYRPDQLNVSFPTLVATTVEPGNRVVEVVYSPVAKPEDPIQTLTLIYLDGELLVNQAGEPVQTKPSDAVARLVDTFVEEGKEATYKWDSHKRDWVQDQARRDKIVTYDYQSIPSSPLLPLTPATPVEKGTSVPWTDLVPATTLEEEMPSAELVPAGHRMPAMKLVPAQPRHTQELTIQFVYPDGRTIDHHVTGVVNGVIEPMVFEAPIGYLFGKDIFVDPVEYSLSDDQKTLTVFGTFDDSELVDGRDSHQQLLLANLVPIATNPVQPEKEVPEASLPEEENHGQDMMVPTDLVKAVEKPAAVSDKASLATSTSETAALPKTGEQSDQLSTKAVAVVSLAMAAGLSVLAYKKGEE